MNKKIVNTQARKDFILNDFIPIVEKFEAQTGLKVHTSGMPYIRTLSAQNIMDEIGLFILAALLSTSAIFFFFFRSFRAMFISMGVVSIAVMWVFGFLGLFGYEITILTGLIPPLVIVIGIPNCVFLINKYQQEISKQPHYGYRFCYLYFYRKFFAQTVWGHCFYQCSIYFLHFSIANPYYLQLYAHTSGKTPKAFASQLDRWTYQVH